MKINRLLAFLFAAFLCACSDDIKPDDTPKEEPKPEVETEIVWNEGVKYVWDDNYIPEITIEVPLEQWNNLLKAYDKNQHTEEYVHCNVRYDRGGEVTYIEDAGLRLRGNTSRVRPEGKYGQMHEKDKADWNKCHFGLNLRNI